MIRKSDGMTPRQKQSQRIMREKAALKKRRAIMQKCYLGVAGALAVILLAGGAWAWKTGAASRAAQSVVDGAYGLTARAGFSVQSLYLEGRDRTPMSEIEKALEVKKGDPILRLSLDDIRARLEKIESVKFAAVERELPGELQVRIIEREPVAQWQHEGKIALVDDNGAVMNGLQAAPYKNLPLIIGDDAPKHVADLLTILASEPDLQRRFAAAIWVGERRWNIRLQGGIEIKLPETGSQEAWKKLAELQSRQQLLDRDVKVIDLRLEGKMFIKMSPEVASGKSASAKET